MDGTSYTFWRLSRLPASQQLPYSLKVLLENLLHSEDGHLVTGAQVQAVANWDPKADHGPEVAFTPARVLMQDFTGVPCVVDLVAMRDAMARLGGDPRRVNPMAPTELVIDHSVIAEVFGRPDAFRVNADLEFERNAERYQLLRWAQQAFSDFRVVPPDRGICHQSTWSTCPGSSSPAMAPRGPWPTRTPWLAPTRTPPWSTASAFWAGE